MFYKDLSNWLTKQLLPIEPDPRLDNYPLMSTWTITALISLTYIIGVYIWRMKIIQRINMDRQRKQQLTNKELNYRKIENISMITYFMIFYNFSMVLFFIYLTISSLLLIHQLDYGLGCIELPNPRDKRTDKLVYYGYLYFLSKFIEMIDTGLFLYRKKVDQVTFLHVFHHASMPPSVWWGLKYAPGGVLYMFPLVNSFVHIIMYTYYGLAAMRVYHLIWWKNYVTLIQMIQFLWLLIHQGQFLISFNYSCNFPKIFSLIICIYSFIFLSLFLNFYIKAYWKRERLVKQLKIQ
ncbi:Elongation of very long chain fatty acids protein [Schistosoma japonicum]|uniref:Elongation of very long chain fatty acids protein n=1 Tax=Schistosoma japonicum TaxID=6182 RepID=A0A4Z2D0C4_SCHJA|nr:Elongation of very long chain fatty acids protein [Schistosoma japonicum]